MYNVVKHKVDARPPKAIDWSFDLRPYQKDLQMRVGPPKGYPQDVRRAQTLQVLRGDGTPLVVAGELRRYTYAQVLSDLEELRKAPVPDVGMTTALESFVAAVNRAYPYNLDELVSHRGAATVASVLGTTETSLANRVSGRVTMPAAELGLLQERFPELDVPETLRALAIRREAFLANKGR